MKLVHYGKAPLSSVRSVVQSEDHFKPQGLWVSDDDCEDSWPAWCESEGFRVENLTHPREVILRDNHNVLIIQTETGIDNLTMEFGTPIIPGGSLLYLDCRALAKRWRGLIITPYQWGRRIDGDATWYYGWDCASGCIWDPAAILCVRSVYP